MERYGRIHTYLLFIDLCLFLNSIADQLLDEQLGHVAAELADVCDKCVDGLYSAEFTIPLDTAHT